MIPAIGLRLSGAPLRARVALSAFVACCLSALLVRPCESRPVAVMARLEIDGRAAGSLRLLQSGNQTLVPLGAALRSLGWRVYFTSRRREANEISEKGPHPKGVTARKLAREVFAFSPYPDANSDPAQGWRDHGCAVFDLDTREIDLEETINTSPSGDQIHSPLRLRVLRGRIYLPVALMQAVLAPRFSAFGGYWDYWTVDVEWDARNRILRLHSHGTSPPPAS